VSLSAKNKMINHDYPIIRVLFHIADVLSRIVKPMFLQHKQRKLMHINKHNILSHVGAQLYIIIKYNATMKERRRSVTVNRCRHLNRSVITPL